jgi:hypothetical protein
MDVESGRWAGRAIVAAGLVAAASGCTRDRPIRPFGSVHTYDSTVVPGPLGHPRGRMIQPQAPGIDLVRRPSIVPPGMASPSAPFDPSAQPAGGTFGRF